MFRGELDLDEVIEAMLILERTVEADPFELLEEEDEDLGETKWVIVGQGEMSLSIQASDIALSQERSGEGERVTGGTILSNVGHQSNNSDLRGDASRQLSDGL